MKKTLSLLLVVSLTSMAYGAIDDTWSLSGDMQNVSNPGPAISPSGSGAGTWTYKSGLAGPDFDGAVSDPTVNCNAEVPQTGIGWVNTAENWIMLVKFTTDNNPVSPWGTGDDKTNFVTGDVGGHANTAALWETDHAGIFKIDYLAYNARIQAIAVGGEIGQTCSMNLQVDGLTVDTQGIVGGIHDGSANAYTNTVYATLAAGGTIGLEMAGADWVGLDMTITEVPEPMTLSLLGLGGLALLRRRR